MRLKCKECGWEGEAWQCSIRPPGRPLDYKEFHKYCICPSCNNWKSARRGMGTLLNMDQEK